MSFNPKKILVPLSLDPEDELEIAKSAIDAAVALSKKFKAELTLLHLASISVPAQSVGFDTSGKIYETLALVLQERNANAKKKLSQMKKYAKDQNAEVKSLVIDTPESLAHGVCRIAVEENMDLIVIGSHSRKGLKKLFLGSVAEKVVHLSKVPVLLLPTLGE